MCNIILDPQITIAFNIDLYFNKTLKEKTESLAALD